MRLSPNRIGYVLIAFALCFVNLTNGLSGPERRQATGWGKAARDGASRLESRPESGVFLVEATPGGARCRPASPDEIGQVAIPPGTALHRISHLHDGLRTQATGLQIVLQATQQLDGFPAAKACFLKAASTWESLIQTPITVVVNVDFGPTRFGQPFPTNVLGSTQAQVVGSSADFSQVRSALLSGASSSAETTMYNSLPASGVPTDLGSTTEVDAPASAFRALGLLPAVADPTSEQSQLGSPPSIGFNSNLSFDFDLNGNVTPGEFEFLAVATHELGHVLGFSSQTGVTQNNPGATLAVSLWDLFRFRSGTTPSSFTTADRIESQGGTQVYYFGGPELGLSTGDPSYGGDGYQPSHWKASSLTGNFIGIMDPESPMGTTEQITQNDLKALDSIGYTLSAGASGSGTVSLSSGQAVSDSVSAAQSGQCALGATQYTISVSQGARLLSANLNGLGQDELLVRFGQAVAVSGGQPVADFTANAAGGTQAIQITPSGSPSLQSGTYYIAVANCTTSSLNFSLTATVTGGSSGGTLPTLTGVTANLVGNSLTVQGTAADADSDMQKLDVVYLDGGGNPLGTTLPFAFNFGTASSASFTVVLNTMQNFPQAVAVSVAVLDALGNVSAPVTANFGGGDPGGPQLSSASFDGRSGVLIGKGSSFTHSSELEVNGVIVTPPLKFKLKGSSKFKVTGTGPEMNLKNGPNRLRVLNPGQKSNILVLVIQ